MFESKPGSKTEDLEIIVRRGPHGAVVLSAIAVAIVIGIWFAFYFFEFLPRGFTR